MIGAFAETADNVYRTRFEGTMHLHRVPVISYDWEVDSFRTLFHLGA